ncbi:YlxQ family RNA-binding protein [Brevibacillus migulae]|uniref:YlxQ family RNA-binding protein n=1 Tax=Brevibacillus migulae TaxID=1644114 RepID=UPI00106E0B36|nr:YlxQ family RNA-binding protein [Brevibacillus migulae]
MNRQLKQMLGLAMRARKVVTGEELVVGAIRSNQAKLVLLATDASANTTKKISDKCSHYAVPLYVPADRLELGAAIGKEARVTVAITDAKLADSIQHLLTPNS